MCTRNFLPVNSCGVPHLALGICWQRKGSLPQYSSYTVLTKPQYFMRPISYENADSNGVKNTEKIVSIQAVETGEGIVEHDLFLVCVN